MPSEQPRWEIPGRLFVHTNFVRLLATGFASASDRAKFLDTWIGKQGAVLICAFGSVWVAGQFIVRAALQYQAQLEATSPNIRPLPIPFLIFSVEAVVLIFSMALLHVGVLNFQRAKAITGHLKVRDQRLADAIAQKGHTVLYLRDFAGDKAVNEGGQWAGYTRSLAYRTTRVVERWVKWLAKDFSIIEFFNAAETAICVSDAPIAVVGEQDWRDRVQDVVRNVSVVIVHVRHKREGILWELMTSVKQKPTVLIASVDQRSHVEALLATEPPTHEFVPIYYSNDIHVLDADRNPDIERAILEMGVRVQVGAGETAVVGRYDLAAVVRRLAASSAVNR